MRRSAPDAPTEQIAPVVDPTGAPSPATTEAGTKPRSAKPRKPRKRKKADAGGEPKATRRLALPAFLTKLRRKSTFGKSELHLSARRDRFSLRDLFAEAAHGIGARPGRLLLTILGTILGIGSVIVTVGLAQTADGQITAQFDAVAATQVVVEPGTTGNSWSGNQRPKTALPMDAPARVEQINGVVTAGLIGPVAIGDKTVTAVPVRDPSAPKTAVPPVVATSGGLLDAVRGTVITGRYFDDGHSARGDRVVVLGEQAAAALGINRVDSQPSIFIGEDNYTVIGIVGGMAARADLLKSVIMPLGTAQADFGLKSADELHIQIETGAGPLVKVQAPIALDPNAPENFKVKAPPTSSDLRQAVKADINAVFLALGGVALLVGGVGIANVTLLSVMERRGEIGLRRALGATRRNIAGQFVVESVVVGMLGGLIGAALGVFVVVGVSILKDWTAILDIRLALGCAALGGVIGLLAGLYPAMKAAAIEPITALRGGI